MNKKDEQLQQKIAQIDNLAKQVMTKEALTRYGNLKIAHPEKAINVAMFIAENASKLQDKIDDATLKQILMNFEPKKSEFKIRRI